MWNKCRYVGPCSGPKFEKVVRLAIEEPIESLMGHDTWVCEPITLVGITLFWIGRTSNSQQAGGVDIAMDSITTIIL